MSMNKKSYQQPVLQVIRFDANLLEIISDSTGGNDPAARRLLDVEWEQ